MHRALVVHGQPEALGELVEVLVRPGLAVDTARSAREGLHKVSARDYAVIISDHKPPDLDGIDLLEKTRAHCPDAMRIVLTSDPESLRDIDDKPPGTIFRFFAKPWDRWQLSGVVAEGLKLHKLEREQKELIKRITLQQMKLQRREKLLDAVVGERTKELEKSYVTLRLAYRQAMLGFAEAIEAKDPYTKGHCSRVAAFTLALARDSGYPQEAMEALEFGSFLHDIGKIGVKDAVLLKPGPLDEDEWIHMRGHPVTGYEIASKLDVLTPAMPAIRNHHEKWDGTGYPDRMVAENIPLSARICAIADAFDAMATDRPYKRALPMEECQRLIRKQAGKMFDPQLAEVFVTVTIPALVEQMADGGYDEDYEEEGNVPAPPPSQSTVSPYESPTVQVPDRPMRNSDGPPAPPRTARASIPPPVGPTNGGDHAAHSAPTATTAPSMARKFVDVPIRTGAGIATQETQLPPGDIKARTTQGMAPAPLPAPPTGPADLIAAELESGRKSDGDGVPPHAVLEPMLSGLIRDLPDDPPKR